MINKKLLIFFLTAIFCISGSYTGISSNQFSDIKISISNAPTPIFFVQNVSNNMSMNSKNRWILIELSYNFSDQKTIKQKKQRRKNVISNPIEDLNRNFQLEIKVLFAGKSNLFLLSKKVKYTAVSLGETTKYALFLIPPQILSKIIPPRTSLTNTYLNKALQIKVDFIENNQTVTEYFYPQNDSTANAFKSLNNNSDVIYIPNGLLNRMQTPWSVIDYDKYELVSQ